MSLYKNVPVTSTEKVLDVWNGSGTSAFTVLANGNVGI